MFNAPAAPAPIETSNIPMIASLVDIPIGAVSKPTAQVKITRDITLGFINLNNSEKLNKSSCDKFLFFVPKLDIKFHFQKSSYEILKYSHHPQTLVTLQKYGSLAVMVQSILK